MLVDRPDQVWANRYHLYQDGPRVSVSGGDNGLVQPVCAGLETIQYVGHTVLPGRLGGALAISQPEIFNSDQGSQFTSNEFTGRLQQSGISISMDGRGRVFDNIFVERLWRSVKYEEVYVHSYESVRDAYDNLTRYFQLYNRERLHESLEYRTPHEVYFGDGRNNDGEAYRLIHQIQPIFVS